MFGGDRTLRTPSSSAAAVLVGLAAAWLYSYREAWFIDRGSLKFLPGIYGHIGTEKDYPPQGLWSDLREDCVRHLFGEDRYHYRLGFEYGSWVSPDGGGRIWLIAVPLWSVAIAAAAVFFGCVAVRARRRRRRAAGRCAACGYDLRGSPNRCPECGTVPA